MGCSATSLCPWQVAPCPTASGLARLAQNGYWALLEHLQSTQILATPGGPSPVLPVGAAELLYVLKKLLLASPRSRS